MPLQGKMYWSEIENQIITERLQAKLNNLTTKAIYTPTWLVEEGYKELTKPVDFEYVKSVSYTPMFYVNPQQQNATDDLGKGYFDRTDWLWENTLTYKKELGKHRVDVLAGYTLQENPNVATTNWTTVGTTPLDDGTTKTVIVNPPVGNRFYRLRNP